MVSLSAVQSEFKALDGLHIELQIRVTDPVNGCADLTQQRIIAFIEDYISKQDAFFAETNTFDPTGMVFADADPCDCDQCRQVADLTFENEDY